MATTTRPVQLDPEIGRMLEKNRDMSGLFYYKAVPSPAEPSGSASAMRQAGICAWFSLRSASASNG